MCGSGEGQRETIRPEFNPAIMIDFRGAKITSDTGFLETTSLPLKGPETVKMARRRIILDCWADKEA